MVCLNKIWIFWTHPILLPPIVLVGASTHYWTTPTVVAFVVLLICMHVRECLKSSTSYLSCFIVLGLEPPNYSIMLLCTWEGYRLCLKARAESDTSLNLTKALKSPKVYFLGENVK